jgi:PIN domain nuclease of toxin-antitoxin system
MDEVVIDSSVILAITNEERTIIPLETLEALVESSGIVCLVNFTEVVNKAVQLIVQENQLQLLDSLGVSCIKLEDKLSLSDLAIVKQNIDDGVISVPVRKKDTDKISTSWTFNKLINSMAPCVSGPIGGIGEIIEDLRATYAKRVFNSVDKLSSIICEISLYMKCYGLSLGDLYCLALGKYLGKPVYTADRVWKDVGEKIGVNIVLIR